MHSKHSVILWSLRLLTPVILALMTVSNAIAESPFVSAATQVNSQPGFSYEDLLAVFSNQINLKDISKFSTCHREVGVNATISISKQTSRKAGVADLTPIDSCPDDNARVDKCFDKCGVGAAVDALNACLSQHMTIDDEHQLFVCPFSAGYCRQEATDGANALICFSRCMQGNEAPARINKPLFDPMPSHLVPSDIDWGKMCNELAYTFCKLKLPNGFRYGAWLCPACPEGKRWSYSTRRCRCDGNLEAPPEPSDSLYSTCRCGLRATRNPTSESCECVKNSSEFLAGCACLGDATESGNECLCPANSVIDTNNDDCKDRNGIKIPCCVCPGGQRVNYETSRCEAF